MKILAILQNTWFRNPERIKAIFMRHPKRRNALIASFLFAGCLTGRRLRAAFGEELCRVITWEEASREIGGQSSAQFKADIDHIRASIQEHNPDVIICFGRIAGDAVKRLGLSMPVLFAPHPAARQNPTPELRRVAAELKRMKEAERG